MCCVSLSNFCPTAPRQNKDHIKPDQLSNNIAAWQAESSAIGVEGMCSFVLFNI